MADFQDVVDAINNLGTQLGARNQGGQPETPEQITSRMEALDAENRSLERQQRLLEQRADSADRDQALRDNEIQQSQLTEKRLKAVNDLYAARGEAQSDEARATKKAAEAAEEYTDKLEEQNHQLRENTKAREDATSAIGSLTNSVTQSMAAYQKHNTVNVANIASMAQQIKKAGLLGTATALLKGSLIALVDSIISITLEVDKESSSLMRNTGITRENALAMYENRRAMAGLGVETKELSAAQMSLRATTTDFTTMSTQHQRLIGETGALLAEQGVSLEDYSKGIQTSTKAFGLSGMESAAASRELNSLAAEIGVLPKQMASDFANAGGQLAKFGSDGVRAFKDLAITSKVTGLSIDKLLKITEKFDTFEGAAEQAGMLNAALGGNFVNAMDLMTTTDPTERFEMIQDAIMNTGLSFDDMSYYQRKFYAEAAGLDDVNDLALLMSGNFDSLAGAQQMTSAEIKDLEARTQEFQNAGEKLQNLLRTLIPHLEPLIIQFHSLAMSFLQNQDNIDNIKDAFSTMGTVLGFVAENFKAVAIGIGALGLGYVIVKFALTAKVIAALGASSTGAVPGMLAFAGAVTLLGVGIGTATSGIGDLAAGFKGLDGTAIAAVAGTLVAMAFGLKVLAGAAITATGPLLTFGGAVVLIGAGIGIAAAGIGAMGAGFGMMFENADADKLGAFAGVIFYLASAIGILGGLGPIGAAGMGILAGGFLALGASIMMMEGSLNAFAVFTGHLSALSANSTGLKQVSTEIVAIADAINTLPLFPTMALSTAFEAARANVEVTSAATAAAAPAAAANTNQVPPKVEVKVYIDDVEASPRKIETTLNGILEPLLT